MFELQWFLLISATVAKTKQKNQSLYSTVKTKSASVTHKLRQTFASRKRQHHRLQHLVSISAVYSKLTPLNTTLYCSIYCCLYFCILTSLKKPAQHFLPRPRRFLSNINLCVINKFQMKHYIFLNHIFILPFEIQTMASWHEGQTVSRWYEMSGGQLTLV